MGKKLTDEQKAARKAKMNWNAEVKRRKHQLEMSFDDAVSEAVPDPPAHRILKVGDRVKCGGFDWAAVYQVFEGGRYYKIITISKKTHQHYSKMKYYELRLHYDPWTDLVKWNDNDTKTGRPILEVDDDLFFQYSQRHLSSLMFMYYRAFGGIDLDPIYQRGNVWGEKQKISMVHSIFCNIDIGKFTLIKLPFREKADPAWEMLDGKQRLTAALEFYESRFKYRGKYYHQLNWHDRIHFREYSISYAESHDMTNEQKLRYFLKLNTTGMPVDIDHITNVQIMLEKEQKKNA